MERNCRVDEFKEELENQLLPMNTLSMSLYRAMGSWDRITVSAPLADTPGAMTDTPLIQTAAKSPAKITDVSLKQTPAIAELRTLCSVPRHNFIV